MPTVAEKRAAFRELHKSGCFVIPNPWDVASARWLQGMGFKALASTSAGFAWSQCLPDNAVTREMVLAHLRELVDNTDVPINADFEGGFADEPAGVAESVALGVDTGVAGLSIEDSRRDKDNPVYSIEEAAARIAAARGAIDRKGGDTLLVGRAENFFVGRPDLDDTIARLKAYSAAGADCLYAPGIFKPEQIKAVVQAVAPKPVNLLIGTPMGLTVKDTEALGVRRISIGGSLARSAWGGFLRAAKQIAEEGRFDAFAEAAPGIEINKFFYKDSKARGGA
ncbi:MAG: isocitrate lyase/phosphoenolpyruvate mutase family protein [Xanthobacteraceae bacterium]|nr:isocitrate lyase/phosphoenolpyruvate mutase family protein [Xanthobacteraceae bacterium]MCW5674983.1 isocitrate lyase/phosphoenolpyruvate mutase family protein [Xanthobacteraceae bacterium]